MGFEEQGRFRVKIQRDFTAWVSVVTTAEGRVAPGNPTEVMGSVSSHCRPYTCLLIPLLKAGGARVSDQRLEELLNAIEVHCSWYPNSGTLDLKTWVKVGTELRGLYHKGVSLPVTIWATWRLIRSVLELLQTDEEDEGEEEIQESEEKEEGSLEAPTIIPKALYPSLENCHASSGPLLDLPPLPTLRMCERDRPAQQEKKTAFLSTKRAPPPPSGGSQEPLSALEKCIRQALLEGDLDALAFQVRMGPAARESLHEPFPFKLLKEIKQAVTQYGPTCPYTMGLIQGVAVAYQLIPRDWNNLAKTCLSSLQFFQFKTWWDDGAETQARRNKAHNINIVKDQLLGSGHWESTQDQLGMNGQAVDQVQRICLMAWEKIETEGKAPMSFQNILQGPQEPYSEFVARLQDAINKQVANLQAAKIILRIVAYDNANADCKKAIGTMEGKTDTMGYIRLCQVVGTEQFKAATLAQALSRFKIGQNKFPGTWYNCRKSGHTRKGCRKKNGNSSHLPSATTVTGPKPPGLCPKCQKGNHWASECRSVFHKNGTPLQKGGRQGRPQAPTAAGGC